ncbi:Bug family tripartite tricarboxylate transporter substrate binding protein [Pseudorhodoferax soli]|uniref:Bug family tripartite tricarboxylate transporter substrate binding protein n=1 Tax=Pseudorhodoferax soli TaxID=545864 RepID=UPI001473C1EE|nr:tripartite tricarboxylate transporter substrate-binding protein [Pseudorhodoferax soli]
MPTHATAQGYPEKGKTLTIVVPFSAGGATDIMARLIGQKFAEQWGVTAVVVNKPGADLLIGSQEVTRAKKDGYTMGLTSHSIALNKVVREGFPFDPSKDFDSVGMVGISSYVLAVDQRSPYKTFQDLEAASQAASDKFSYASCCTGTFIATEMLKEATKLKGLHIPYKGSAPAVNAMMGGETQFIMDTVTAVKPFIDSGKLRPLLITTREGSGALPGVPGLKDAKIPGTFEIAVWWGMVLPPATPPEIVAEANRTLNRILSMPDVRQRMEGFQIDVLQSTPKEMTERWQTDLDKYTKLVKAANLSFAN